MAWVYGRSPAEFVGSNPAGGHGCSSVECHVLSGGGIGDEMIARPEESYPLWCVLSVTRILKNEKAISRAMRQLHTKQRT